MNNELKHNGQVAILTRHCQTHKWIFCLTDGNRIESDELASRHGQFTTRKAAREAFIRLASAGC